MIVLRKYNTATAAATHVSLPLIKRGVVDYAVSADWTPAAGDVKLTKDGDYANTANITTLPTAKTHGNTALWEFQFSATELSCKKLEVTIADAATKAVEDQTFFIETYGNASAMYQADLSAANLPANVTQWLGTAAATPTVAGVPEVDVTHVGGTAQTAGDIIGDTNDIQSRLPAALTSGGRMKASLEAILDTAPTEGAAGRLAAAFTTQYNVAAPVFTAASVNQTGDSFARLGVAGAGLTDLGGMSTTMKAQVQTEAEDALVAKNLDRKVLATFTVNDVGATTTQFITNLTSATDNFYQDAIVQFTSGANSGCTPKPCSSYVGSTKTVVVGEAFPSAPANGDTGIIWSAHIHTTSAIGTAVWASSARTLTGLGFSLAAGDIAANAFTDAKFATGAFAKVWSESTRTLSATGLAAITAWTVNITGTLSGNVGGIAGVTFPTNFSLLAIDAAGRITVGAFLSTLDLTATMKASVNTEVVDCLNVDTYAEPGQEAPPATTTLVKKIGYTYKSLRNKKTQTATERKLYADDGTTVDQKATDSDDGTTFTKGELGTGP